MFEYTALVDAPVQRFTSIVTGSDPEDEPRVVGALVPPAPVAVPKPSAPLVPGAFARPADEAPEPRLTAAEAAATLVAAQPVAPHAVPAQSVAPQPDVRAAMPRPQMSRPRAYGPPEPSAKQAVVPALVAIAAASVTAMWWLRRDSHAR